MHAHDAIRLLYVLPDLLHGHRAADADAICPAVVFDHLGPAQRAFQLPDPPFQKALFPLGVVIVGVLRQVALADSLLQAIRKLQPLDGGQVFQLLFDAL